MVIWVECSVCRAVMLAKLPEGTDTSKVRCRPCADKARKVS
jgi:hypothetical protein